ncbi:MAG: putative iron(III) transporter, solute-binding protein [Paenibacillaceae bacterium]|jgi:iron complex transport system substrate-binding protein|nr:putative iron(III) transporter, solute-binding protein [Paenibacillaceae bacterium]
MKRDKMKIAGIGAVLSAAVLLGGCGGTTAGDPQQAAGPSAESKASPAAAVTPAASAAATRTVTDMGGQQIELPTKIERYGESWFAHNEVDIMVDQAKRMVATNTTAKTYPWMYLVAESMNNALSTFGTDYNLEELVARKPQLVFASSNADAEKLKSVGIPVVNAMFSTYDDMKKSVLMTGEILGEESLKQAQKYNGYLDGNIAKLNQVLGGLTDSQKPSVLHGSVTGMTVDGKNTIIDAWIKLAGGTNAGAEIDGNMKAASMEQILLWNPQILIVPTKADAEKAKSDPNWSKIDAVKNGKVIINPKGVFSWDRYGVESALQILWAAKQIHPDKFADLDINKEIKTFYADFLNYSLTDEQVQKILNAEAP